MKEINSGQVWSYHSRKGESNSRVTVLAVEKDSNYGNIVHVRIDGLYITDTRGIYIGDCIEHLPIAEDSFLESVIHVEGEAHYDLGEGYISGDLILNRMKPESGKLIYVKQLI